MRTISADDNALFTSVGGRATYLRVDVQDAAANWRDLTSFGIHNMLLSATWRDAVDQEGQSVEITLKREEEQTSLSPFMQASPLNQVTAYQFPQSFSALLQVKRGVRVYSADVPTDALPAAANWRLMFEGKIDSFDIGNGESVMLECTDAQGDLRDTFIETERVYSFAQGLGVHMGCRIWKALDTFTLPEIVIPTDANRNGHFYNATTAGTVSSGGAEPAWPTGAGGTVADGGETWQEVGTTSPSSGTAVETVMNQIIADNGGSATIQIPGGSPAWNIKWFLQQRQSVWDALRTLADQIGWDLRYGWNGSGFQLNLTSPSRAKTTPDRTFAISELIAVTGLKVDGSRIRNAIAGVYSASGTMDPSGNPLRVRVVVTDATSITKYGRRFMEIGEASTSNIDTTAELQTMLNAALADLKEPLAEKSVTLPYFPFVELGDLYRFSPDGIYSDQNLDLAIISYEHTINSEGEASTTLTCRGKPSSGGDRWLSRASECNPEDIHQLGVVDSNQPTIAAQSVVGGTLLTQQSTQNKKSLGQDVEWHVGTSSVFTPDNTTLIQSQGGNQVTVPHLIPNKAYFAKAIPIRRNAQRIVRGEPSTAFGFTAGRASAGHIHEGIALGDMPLNGGFETWLDTSGPPDHWTVLNGVWGTDFRVVNDAAGVSGSNYLFFSMNSTPAVLTKMRSAIIPLINDDSANTGLRLTTRYLLEGWVKTDAFNSGGNHLIITAAGVDYQGNLIGLMGGNTISVAATSNLGKWQYVQTLVHCDGFSTMKGVYIVIQTDTAGTLGLSNYYIDELRLKKVQSPWYIVNQTTKFTDNYQSLPPFTNAWVADVTVPAFRRDPWGYIELKGSVKNGVIGNSAFTLPVGFRPAELKRMPLISAFNTPGEMDITTAGLVTPATGNNGWVSLDNIRFWPYL